MRKRHRTVDRVAGLLEAAARRPDGSTLSSLARRVGAPVSSVQKLVDGLVAAGNLDERDRRYTLGPAPWMLAARAGEPPVPAIPHEALDQLARHAGLPVLLAARIGDDAVYLDWAGADEAFDVALSARVRAPLPDTAAGRVLLAHLAAPERKRVALAAHDGDPGAAAALLEACGRIRADGFERGASGALLPGATAVAVALRHDGRVTGALSAAARGVGPLPGEVVDALADAAGAWSS
ncbi:IclR family transcriptional regulator [Pseudonocardia sp. ICBG1293]|uniref:IclR family transcriptional regulator n=1 Tax=Pseudonocardia sp. ICBG1293 TaxID=2844382 RepID=UPI001CCD3C14|nr:helix-turn-helix domain-containing protein [Pseudonocardia sp. ICBG1293]